MLAHKPFERENPASLQEITAVMMESARKEMWKASEQQQRYCRVACSISQQIWG